MAWEIPVLDFTLEAAADLTTKQYFLVIVDANGKAALAGAGGNVAGAVQNEPNTGEAVSIRTYGITKVVAGAAITAGANVEADAAGKAITATTNPVFGIALQSAAGDNSIISVLITHAGIQ